MLPGVTRKTGKVSCDQAVEDVHRITKNVEELNFIVNDR